jgi:ribonuclease R
MKITEASILAFMSHSDYKPLDRSELARQMNVKSNERSAMREALRLLEDDEKIKEGKKGRYEIIGGVMREDQRIVGTIRFTPKSFAWLYADIDAIENKGVDFSKADRYRVEARDASTALDGDRVSAVVIKTKPRAIHRRGKLIESTRGDESPKAKVEKIITRKSGQVIGIFRKKENLSWIEVDDVAIKGSLELAGETTAQPGQTIVVAIDKWDDSSMPPRGRVVEVLGWSGDPGVDILSVIHRNGLRTSFTEEVIAEAHQIKEEIPADEISRREDWRDKLVITIDPADAKDHDDAIWLERTSKGWLLAVHIADVSHYVKPTMLMDKEARQRGNSTYLVDRVLPMLPPELSNGICSLKPNVDRLTKCTILEIDERGEVLKSRFVDAVIHSRAKLSYEEAQAMLDDKITEPTETVAMVKEAWKMASVIRKRRFDHGSLDLEFPEFKVILNEKGEACEVREVQHTASHQLIEECMLVANEAVANILKNRQKPVVYRVHEDPDAEKLLSFSETARSFGYQTGDLSNRIHVQKLLNQAKEKPDEHVIKLGLLKSLKRAIYHGDPLGHYGLAKQDYCHFTSPIRRYADLIVHRALQPLLSNSPKQLDKTPSQAEISEIANHISNTERVSAGAESETKLLKLMEWLGKSAGNPDGPIFKGMVTEIRPMGLFVEAISIGMKGVVKREELPEGEWFFDAARINFSSRQGQAFKVGQAVSLLVKRVDIERKFVDFKIAETETATSSKSKKTDWRKRTREKEKYDKTYGKKPTFNKPTKSNSEKKPSEQKEKPARNESPKRYDKPEKLVGGNKQQRSKINRNKF